MHCCTTDGGVVLPKFVGTIFLDLGRPVPARFRGNLAIQVNPNMDDLLRCTCTSTMSQHDVTCGVSYHAKAHFGCVGLTVRCIDFSLK